MPREFAHESDAESSNLIIGPALWIEIGTTFCTTHVDSRECILEDLFESEEFEDGQVDGRVETKTTLVWA